MRYKKSLAFSLVEVIMIVAIASILAALTIPVYQQNHTKVRISRIVPILDRLMHDILTVYAATGSTPATLDGVNGTGGGGYGALVIGTDTTNMFYNNGSGWSNKGAMVYITVSEKIGKGVPGYVQSTTGADGAYNALSMAFYDNNGTIQIYCGNWDTSSTLYIPDEYLPPGCNNENFYTNVMG